MDCAVYHDHQLLFRYFEGTGERARAGNELYIIFSMTKMLTCTAALQLLEHGKYRLDDPISMYMPEFGHMQVTDTNFDTEASAKIAAGQVVDESGNVIGVGIAKNPITVRHLFTMTAGFDYDLKAPPLQNALSEGKRTTGELVSALSQTVLGFDPGTRFRYSLCHDILGGLIEIWSGKRLGEYLQENVFAPLGVKDTFFDVPQDAQRLSRMMKLYIGYDRENPKHEPLDNWFNLTDTYESGCAGLTSCTRDYALFLDALACGGVGKTGARILSWESVLLMGTNQLQGKPLADF